MLLNVIAIDVDMESSWVRILDFIRYTQCYLACEKVKNGCNEIPLNNARVIATISKCGPREPNNCCAHRSSFRGNLMPRSARKSLLGLLRGVHFSSRKRREESGFRRFRSARSSSLKLVIQNAFIGNGLDFLSIFPTHQIDNNDYLSVVDVGQDAD
jgi:hypothetical protein